MTKPPHIVGREHLGSGVYARPGIGTQREIVLNDIDDDMIIIDELVWQRMIVYGVRMGFKLPQEVVSV